MNPTGVAYALLAYGAWGIVPMYWALFDGLPAPALLALRVLSTALFSAALLTLLRRWREAAGALAQTRQRVALPIGALLIGCNWLIFIWAVHNERVLETSLGYYLNPLINVLLGNLLLRERLRAPQAVAVALAAVGVGGLVFDHGGLPWVSLTLATTFALYGLVHKLTEVRPIPRLGIETFLLAPLAAAFLLLREDASAALIAAPEVLRPWLLIAGPLTALPLLWFASAARRMTLTALGLFQYIAPTLTMLIAVFHFGEPMRRAHIFAFVCIWLALALFTADAFRTARRYEREASLGSA